MLEAIGMVTVCSVVLVFTYLATSLINDDRVKSFSFLGFGVALLGTDAKFNKQVNKLMGTDRTLVVLVPVFLIKYCKGCWATNMFTL